MASLQIRELPDDIYEALARRAKDEGRSLAQQAVHELKKLPEVEARRRRQETVSRLRARLETAPGQALEPSPEELVRRDRER
jgi:plasmid stability protein